MKYVAFGAAGAATTTAATAGIIGIYNPASATMAAAKIYEWAIGAGANSADNTYSVRAKRVSSAPVWTTAITPSPLDAKAGASVTLAGAAQTTAGSAGVMLGQWGFHMRGGYRWVAIPGGELVVPLVFSNGIILEYFFAQGTDVMEAEMYFEE